MTPLKTPEVLAGRIVADFKHHHFQYPTLENDIEQAIQSERSRCEELEQRLDKLAYATTVVECKVCKIGYRNRDMADGYCAKCLLDDRQELLKDKADLQRRLAQMEKLVGGIDVENPDAVDTMIDAIKIQKENYQKFKEELLSGIKMAVEELLKTDCAHVREQDPEKYKCVHSKGETGRGWGGLCPLHKQMDSTITTLNKLVEKYK